MTKRKILTLLVLLMVAVTGAWAKKDYYAVTFGGFDNGYQNTTVTVALPHTFTEVGGYDFDPWQIFENGDEFTNVSVTNDGNGKVSASMINWGSMSITVSGAFDGTATIHVDCQCMKWNDETEDYDVYPASTDITVQCAFAYEVFEVTYDANGGSGAPSAQEKRNGTDLTLSSTVPTRTGYTFAGWNTDADGNGTSYAAGAAYAANADVTLYAQWDEVNVTGVTLNEPTATLTVGETLALTATVAPDNAPDKTVTWTVGGTDASAVKLYTDENCNTEVGSAATATLTVYAKGLSAGEATVTVASNADPTKTATCTVTVSPAGYSVTLKENTEDDGNWTAKAGTDGTYQPLPLTGVKAGTAVSVKYSGTKRVKSVRAKKIVKVTSITLNKTAMEITVGEKETLTVDEVLPDDATDKSVIWSSSNTGVATVNAETGEVTAVTPGTATITATATDGSGVTATCAVTVKNPIVLVTSITLNKTATEITAGQTETLSVTAVAPDNATDKTYTWKSSDESKATVDQTGKVTAVAAGTVTIYAEANDGSGVKGNCAVTVKAAPTLAETMTTAGMTVKVNYNYYDGNYCQFVSNGDGTYTFQSGSGFVGGDNGSAKALVVEGGKLVFKQNFYNSIDYNWDDYGFSVTFRTSKNTYAQWAGETARDDWNASFTSVEVNGTTISLTENSKIDVDDLTIENGWNWETIVSNNSDKIFIDIVYVKRISDGAKLLKDNSDVYYWDDYDSGATYTFEGD